MGWKRTKGGGSVLNESNVGNGMVIEEFAGGSGMLYPASLQNISLYQTKK